MGKYYTQDHFALHLVKLYLTMEFVKVSVCQFVPPLNFSLAETECIDAYIFKLLGEGVIANTSREHNDCDSVIFMRSKKDDKYRMILNLEKFNEFLKFKYCK